eukprot:2602218-Alexandrium_andersonii.AAC.1
MEEAEATRIVLGVLQEWAQGAAEFPDRFAHRDSLKAVSSAVRAALTAASSATALAGPSAEAQSSSS